jgi:lipoprotein-anchoring transpeptidase ErfK/SrfK
MSRSSVPPRKSLLYPVLIILLICAVIGVAAWTATSSPVLSLYREPTLIPTHPNSFALVEIGKPTYTPSPTFIPSPTALPTNTPEAVIQAQIVMDSAAPAIQNPYEAPVPSYSGNKYILVDISEQHMYVYEGDAVVYSFVSSTGMKNATRTGLFSVLDKIPNAYGATWDLWMPNWLGIYYAGSLENGIHALPILSNGATLWEGFLGTPISFGCVVLGTYESKLLYDWAEVGTPVEIQW